MFVSYSSFLLSIPCCFPPSFSFRISPLLPLPLSSSAAITEELLQLTEDKRDPSVLRGFDSPFLRTTETLTSAVDDKPAVGPAALTSSFSRDGPLHPLHPLHLLNTTSTPTSTQDKTGSDGGGQRGGRRGLSQDGVLPWAFQPVFTPIEAAGPTGGGGDQRLQRSPCASMTTTEEDALKMGMLSPSPCRPTPALPYEALFDLALPRAASLFVARKTLEATQRATVEWKGQRGGGGGGGGGVGVVGFGFGEGEEEESDLGKLMWRDGEVDGELGLGDGEGDGELSAATASPLEVLDRLVQQGNDVHDKVLKR